MQGLPQPRGAIAEASNPAVAVAADVGAKLLRTVRVVQVELRDPAATRASRSTRWRRKVVAKGFDRGSVLGSARFARGVVVDSHLRHPRSMEVADG